MLEAITIGNLTKEYTGGTTALRSLSFSIKPGEFFALLGPNGAGKTTTINIITGLANKSSGEVQVLGKDVFTEYKEARSCIGLVPQEFNMDHFERVQNVLFFNAGYFGVRRKERAAKVEKLLHDLGLWEKRTAKIRELSSGMKRKVMIARALIHQPKILILDEPTAGVDVETRRFLWDYFQRLNRQGTTILLTTHYIEEAEELCERIAIINNGEIVALDKTENLLTLLERETVTLYLKEKVKKVPLLLKKYKAKLGDNIITLEINPKKADYDDLIATLHKLKLPLQKIETNRATLEDVFLHLTKK